MSFDLIELNIMIYHRKNPQVAKLNPR